MNPNTTEEETTSKDLLQEEDLSMEGYDKPVKQARNILFSIAAIQLIGIISLLDETGLTKTISICVIVAISLVFLLLGLWTKRKPFDAIITGLIVYSALLIGDAIFDPSTLFNGIIFKIVIYGLLISAISNARDVQRWKDSLKQN